MVTKTDNRDADQPLPRWYMWFAGALTTIATGMIVARVIWPDRKIDTTTIGLLVLAMVPWLVPIFRTLSLEGLGIKLHYEREKRIEAAVEAVKDNVGANVNRAEPLDPEQPTRRPTSSPAPALSAVEEEAPAKSRATTSPTDNPTTPEEWSELRDGIKLKSREVYLAHMITESKRPRQKFDIVISLAGPGDSPGLPFVESAEFFFGAHWGNRVFEAKKVNGRVGISTSAFGPFLCVCRIHFTDSDPVIVHRFIDFEMEPVIDALKVP